MELSQFIQSLVSDPASHERLAYVHRQAPRGAIYQDLVPPLPPVLQRALAREQIDRLYTHQAQAITITRGGRHAGVVTATASGKTLCYHLPTLEALLTD